MLYIHRRPDEEIILKIGERTVTVRVCDIGPVSRGDRTLRARLGITADRDIPIRRSEVPARPQDGAPAA